MNPVNKYADWKPYPAFFSYLNIRNNKILPIRENTMIVWLNRSTVDLFVTDHPATRENKHFGIGSKKIFLNRFYKFIFKPEM